MKLSVIIPVYNEEMTIGELIDRVTRVDVGHIEMEVIVANDGSTDTSELIIESRRAARPELIKLHSTPINLGKGAAVRLGLHYATGDLILIQDADLELNPDEYHLLLAPVLAGESDVVYGSRFLNKHKRRAISSRTRLANRFLTTLTNVLFRGKLTDMETAYKLFRREVLQGVRLRCVHFDFEPEITGHLLKAGCRIKEVPISYNPRRADEGKKISWVDGVEAIYTLLRVRFS
ncbi:MAG: glycosyltransferase family 2 protein [Chloroflexi bacterium]|nr:glycosyltransferase family 2 protein [Chloroflexota bacterium]MCI0578886.1 glycosyltransferase family 2 protein [Chloroflexota bacterium]MCI0649127.1 glycosyltransferase family 2 protein [Chloroflexota bacterium]MCI0727042.1 glycosyltransferase family 2 protein [Chloroflexota bacterium]